MATWVTSGGIGDLVPYMNSQGPSTTELTDATRPTYAIGSAVRFRWIVPTGTATFDFNLFIHGRRAKLNTSHALIENIVAANWVASGTVVLHGLTWDIYYRDIILADTVAGLYSICLAQNGLHYMEPSGQKHFVANGGGDSFHHDGGFFLTPTGRPHYDDLPDRTELHSRVAGEKAWYPDEFVTATQLEAGTGVIFRYRDETGAVTGYGTVAANAYNIIVEATGVLGVRENVVTGLNLGTGAAISWSAGTAYTPISEVAFASELLWVLDNTLTRTSAITGTANSPSESVPVVFDLIESPTGSVKVMARTLYSGIWASHDDGVGVTEFNTAPNGTLQHVQFKDTSSVTFTITEGNIAQTTGVYRHGIIVEAVGYAGWRISDDALDFDLITTNEEVQFVGLKGVTTNLVLGTPNQLEISRPLQIQGQDVNVGNDSTVTLNFEDGTNTTAVVTDDGSGKRTVVINATGSGAGEDSYKSHWWLGNGIADASTTFAWMPSNDFANYYNLGPCGMYVDATWAVRVGTDFEQVIVDGSNFTEATAGPPQYEPHNDHAVPRPLTVGANGIYNLNITVDGMHSRSPLCGAAGIQAHRMDVTLLLLVNRGAVLYTYQFNDRYQYSGIRFGTLGNFDASTKQNASGYGDSIPWTVQGSCEVYLQANDEVMFLLMTCQDADAAGNGHTYGDIRRHFYVRYFTFDIAYVKSGTSAGSVTLHGLSDMANDGRPAKFETFNW